MITVKYWRSTTQHEEQCFTYAEAVEIASRNQNAFPPRFYGDRGEELFDDGNGLWSESTECYEA